MIGEATIKVEDLLKLDRECNELRASINEKNHEIRRIKALLEKGLREAEEKAIKNEYSAVHIDEMIIFEILNMDAKAEHDYIKARIEKNRELREA